MSRLKDLFLRSASAKATSVNLPPVQAKPAYVVTNKAGKWGAHYRRIVRHTVTGPNYRQLGIRWHHGEALPVMQQYMVHKFLHATKGWRTYTHGLPGFNPMRRPV